MITNVTIASHFDGQIKTGYQYDSATGEVLTVGGINNSDMDSRAELGGVSKRGHTITKRLSGWLDVRSLRLKVSLDEDGRPFLPVTFRSSWPA